MSRHIFTPVIRGQRIKMFVSKTDIDKIKRGPGWKAEVTDLDSGRIFDVWPEPCSFSTCFCDAGAREIGIEEALMRRQTV